MPKKPREHPSFYDVWFQKRKSLYSETVAERISDKEAVITAFSVSSLNDRACSFPEGLLLFELNLGSDG